MRSDQDEMHDDSSLPQDQHPGLKIIVEYPRQSVVQFDEVVGDRVLWEHAQTGLWEAP